MANHLTDVASSDQHTVKPWLDEKLDFAAPVVDLANDGLPLLGGRLDYMDNHAVAALVFQRRKHYINLFVWPAEAGSPKTSKISRQGCHLLHWSDADFNYWAVSDVNADDLQAFQELFAKSDGRRKARGEYPRRLSGMHKSSGPTHATSTPCLRRPAYARALNGAAAGF
jgi:anti-sigma factor RsiW